MSKYFMFFQISNIGHCNGSNDSIRITDPIDKNRYLSSVIYNSSGSMRLPDI